jgi:hypothetical protein
MKLSRMNSYQYRCSNIQHVYSIRITILENNSISIYRDVTVTSPTTSGWVCPIIILRSFTRLGTDQGLQNGLNVLSKFCSSWKLEVNTKKSKIMLFNSNGKSFLNHFKLDNEYAKREFFFQNLTLGYMTKTLIQIIFFFLHQNQNIFFSNIGNQNIC